MYRSDARYHHSYYNEHDFVTAADQYPKFGASREELVGHAKKLHGLTTEIIDNVQQDGHVLDLEALLEFGCSSKDNTAGRKRLHDDVTNEAVNELLHGATLVQLQHSIRSAVKAGMEGLEDEIESTINSQVITKKTNLPKYGTGLVPIYRNMEDRLARGTAFDLSAQVHKAVAILRSLEKLASSDWCEQGEWHAGDMAERVQAHLAKCATKRRMRIM